MEQRRNVEAPQAFFQTIIGKLTWITWSQIFRQNHVFFVGEAERGSSNIPQSLLGIPQSGEEWPMERINHVYNIIHVDASPCVESIVLVCRMVLAVKSIVAAQKAVKIVSVDATVQRVNAEADNVRVLLLGVNVILMFAAIVGLAVVMVHRVSLLGEEKVNVVT